MTSRTSLVILAFMTMVGLLAGRAFGASSTIQNIPPTAHNAPAGSSLEDIGRAIMQAAGERQWYGAPNAPGSIVASTNVRTHRAVVDIAFDAANLWINYRESTNLNFSPKDLIMRGPGAASKPIVKEGPRIHPNYNVWVRQLADQVAGRTAVILEANRGQESEGSVSLIADELEKLDRLRQRGVLTQDEFDEQKKKLLAR